MQIHHHQGIYIVLPVQHLRGKAVYRYEEDDIDALGYFMMIGAVAFLCIAIVAFAAWAVWL